MLNTGKRAEELAVERNLTLFRLAQISGICYSTLKMARTRGTQLSVDTIECICRGLGISMADFFDESDARTS